MLRVNQLDGVRDRIIIRDARGRSSRPALVSLPLKTGRSLAARGPFTVIQRFQVAPGDGASFVEAMRDGNPIHTQGDIIPGAMTAARALILPELLLGSVRVKRAKVKFRGLAYYRKPTVNVFRIEPRPDHLKIDLAVYQEGARIADGLVSAHNNHLMPGPGKESQENFHGECAETSRIQIFLKSLGIDPPLYFRSAGPVYPRAYLAALPPGEMVRKFSGEGGILNSLDLEFPDEAVLGLDPAPTVEVEKAARSRKTFRKVLARIARGMRTLCSGFALVVPGEAAGGILGD